MCRLPFNVDAHHCKKMLDSKICIQIKGQRALFCRPEMSVERRSYDVPTISSMQGVLRAVFNHDGMDYKINDIFVCRKIRYDSIVRNETKVMQDMSNPVPYLLVDEERTQRSSLFLVNVEYVVGAEIIKKPNEVSKKEHSLFGIVHFFEKENTI